MNAAGHLTAEEAAAFVRPRGALPPAERLALSDHAATCAPCRTLLAAAREEEATPSGQEAERSPAHVFTDLLIAGRQPTPDENTAPGSWTGEAEFTGGTLPDLTPQEREEMRAYQAQLDRFEAETFAPGGTLEEQTTSTPYRQVVPVARTRWWSHVLFSWPGYALAGAAAALALAAVVWLKPVHKPASSQPFAASKPAARPGLADGPLRVAADGTLDGLAAIPADLRDAVLETIRQGAAPGALVGRLTRGGPPASPVPGPNPVQTAATLLSPLGTTIDTVQPTFRWQAPVDVDGAVTVVVRPSSGGEEIRSEPLPPGRAEWTLPRTLARGALYRWQVVPVTPEGQPVTNAPGAATRPTGAIFKVLSEDAHRRLEDLRSGPAGQSHLTLGVAYAREGMRPEAAQEFRKLERNNDHSPLARQLVASMGGESK